MAKKIIETNKDFIKEMKFIKKYNLSVSTLAEVAGIHKIVSKYIISFGQYEYRPKNN